MNSRHAAALALVGWYLMTPPASDWTRWKQRGPFTTPGFFLYRGFIATPLPKWKRQSEFDSQIECEKARQRLTTRDGPGANQLPTNAKQYFAAHAQCISTDDPRLKAK